MKKWGSIGLIGLTAVLIGLVLSIQILTTSGSDIGGLVPLAKLQDYEVALKQVRNEKEDALEELANLRERLEAIESEAAEEDAIISGLVSDVEKYKMASGMLDMEGPGVYITINNPENAEGFVATDIITYNYELILSLVNKLKEAGAEAISINEHRLVHTTEISLASNHIMINGSATAAPYYIKAIGNPDTIYNALTIRGGIIEAMRDNYGLNVEIEKRDQVIVPRYNGVISFKYAETYSSDNAQNN